MKRRANDRVPRDEMLLAEGLAWGIKPGGFASLLATAISGNGRGRVDRSAFMGAYAVIYGRESDLFDSVDDGDAYAAGAALAMELERE